MTRHPLELATPRLILREPVDADASALLAYHLRNEKRFAPWEPRRGDDIAYHRRWIAWRRDEGEAGHARTFFSFVPTDRENPVGITNLDAISKEPRASAMLSYSVDGAYEGQGYAREAAEAVIAYAFGELELDEISATYDPANARSGGLLQRLGFHVVATSPVIPGMERLMRSQVLASLTASV